MLCNTPLSLASSNLTEYYPGSLKKSSHQTTAVTTKVPHYHDHIWIRDNTTNVDVHGSKMQKDNENYVVPSKAQFYDKGTYPVLIGNRVEVFNTRLFASLPSHNKYMVKEKIPEMKLMLKSTAEDTRFAKCDGTSLACFGLV